MFLGKSTFLTQSATLFVVFVTTECSRQSESFPDVCNRGFKTDALSYCRIVLDKNNVCHEARKTLSEKVMPVKLLREAFCRNLMGYALTDFMKILFVVTVMTYDILVKSSF